MMNIGKAAKASGVSAKMIRYYEATSLIPKAIRSEAGYRHYTENDVHTLRFIRRARDLGFSIEQIGELLTLWRDRSRASADVKAVALDHVAGLKHKIGELQAMARTLEYLAKHCSGDHRPECPILEDLAKAGEAASQTTRPATRRDPVSTSRFGETGRSPTRNSLSRSVDRGTSRHPTA